MHPLAKLDHRHVWHPFTQMRDWLKREPIVIVEGHGAVLRDARGREYLDANSSIWTNLHGHNHAKINAALKRQLNKIAHNSALGLANEPASLLARKLVEAAHGPGRRANGARSAPFLNKVFFSDDGATAMEAALKLAHEFAVRSGRARRPKFVSLAGAYHGDTVGAMALGHQELFRGACGSLLFKTEAVMAPYCYRCPFNRARPERADAREYRCCNWECIGKLEQKFTVQKKRGNSFSAFVFEPLIQGAAGMIPQPAGWLRRAAEIARGHGAMLVADEVMTGFGRTGTGAEAESKSASRPPPSRSRRAVASPLFACQHEEVEPDFLALAKGLTGGYLPMAATLTTQAVFDAFLGEYAEFKTFFHGHSFTANPLGAAAGLASLELLESPDSVRARRRLEQTLREELRALWRHPNVGDVRQVGLTVGVELVRDWRTREPFDLRERAGIRVCEAMARRGVLTRPIGNVIVLMPPYCTTDEQVRRMISTLGEALG
jgi:adenosylmethionine-8-amino-7-oxononanoate aminotransferase